MINQNNNATDTTSLQSPNQTDPTLFVRNSSIAGYDRDDRLQPDAIVTQTGSGIGCNAVSEQNAGIQGMSLNSYGVIGIARKTGVLGQNGLLGGLVSATDPAVLGVAWGPTGQGVGGIASGPLQVGVSGSGDFGVFGHTSATKCAGVFGSASANSVGVWGHTFSDSWPGVGGFNSGIGPGVRGVSVGTVPAGSLSNTGVVGFSDTGCGVIGIANHPWGLGVGGLFFGGLVVASGAKSAAVRHRDGSHRLFYSLESPESWFEDYGRARLLRGRADVKLEPTFAGFVRLEDYHVFLSPEGESKGLYVSRRSRTGFSVREANGGRSTTNFSYRIVARRKDLEIKRFKPVQLPVIKDSEFLRRPEGAAKLKPPVVPDVATLPMPPRWPPDFPKQRRRTSKVKTRA